MKTFISLLSIIIMIACTKDSDLNKPTTLGSSTLIANGSLDLQTSSANIASLEIVNYRSSFELCGTSGENLIRPVILPLSDTAVYPANILMDSDSLSAEIYVDSTLQRNFSISLKIIENLDTISIANANGLSLKTKFRFNAGSSYKFLGDVK